MGRSICIRVVDQSKPDMRKLAKALRLLVFQEDNDLPSADKSVRKAS